MFESGQTTLCIRQIGFLNRVVEANLQWYQFQKHIF